MRTDIAVTKVRAPFRPSSAVMGNNPTLWSPLSGSPLNILVSLIVLMVIVNGFASSQADATAEYVRNM